MRVLRGGFARRFLIVAALLGAVRVALPYVLRAQIQSRYPQEGDVQVSLAGIDMALWRGAYEIEDFVLHLASQPDDEPLLVVRRADLSVDAGALVRGTLAGEIVLHGPRVSRVAEPAPEEEDAEDAEPPPDPDVSDWQNPLDPLFPFQIDRFVVRDAELRYADPHSDPPVDLHMTDFYAEALNLSNVRSSGARLSAEIEAAGRPFGVGEFELALAFDPAAEDLRLELDAEARDMPLVAWNDYFRAYGNVDVEDGKLGLYTELAIADGRVTGYVKTLLEDVEVFRFGEIEDAEEALGALWEALVAVAAEVLENQPRDRLATRVPIEGDVHGTSTEVVPVVLSLLRNAFVEALRPALDHSIELEDVSQGGGEPR